MIGVAEDDLRAEALEIAVGDRLHGALRSDRHERRRLDRPMGGGHDAAARAAVGMGDAEREGRRRHRERTVYNRGDSTAEDAENADHRRWTGNLCALCVLGTKTPLKKTRIGIIYGGRSSEHEV